MIAAIVSDIVDFARRRAALVAIAALAMSLAAGLFAVSRLAIDTSLDRMLPSDVAWRQNENALDLAFPQNDDLLVVVIDGQTPDLADRAARELTDRMRAEWIADNPAIHRRGSSHKSEALDNIEVIPYIRMQTMMHKRSYENANHCSHILILLGVRRVWDYRATIGDLPPILCERTQL